MKVAATKEPSSVLEDLVDEPSKVLTGPTLQQRDAIRQIIGGYPNTLQLIKINPYEDDLQ